MVEASQEARIYKITENYEQEMSSTKKTLKRTKEIKEELKDLTEVYQKNVLERTDELEQLGQLPAGQSKDFSKKILELSKLVPPEELQVSINNLET